MQVLKASFPRLHFKSFSVPLRVFSSKYKAGTSTKPLKKETLKVFKNIIFDEEGRFLVLHHHGAAKYYKMNIIFLALFFGFSFRNYKYNPAVFMGERMGQIYLSLIAMGILGMLIFGNRHIRSFYLLPNGREIIIETYSNFGLTVPK